MTIIEPSVEIIEEKDPYKKVELCARTCYARGTEILTHCGFKKVEDIKESDSVLTYNGTKNILEY